MHRANLDRNPGLAMDWHRGETERREEEVRVWAGRYLKTKPSQIALTDNTTEGLAMIYAGIHVRPDQGNLTSEHEHYAANSVFEFRTQKDGTQVRKIKLFEDPSKVSTDEILASIAHQHPPRNPRARHDLGALRQTV